MTKAVRKSAMSKLMNYCRQNNITEGKIRLTPKQSRRIRHSLNKDLKET